MTFDTKKTDAVREAFTLVEIYLDKNDPALDSEFANEATSYGTPKTTDDPRAYTGTDFRVYRYCDQQLFGVDHFPGLSKTKSNPPKIDPGKSVGFRASARVEIMDFTDNDVYQLPSPYDDRRVEGSHFLKLIARNHLKNRRCRILRGFDPFNFDEANCQIENYIIDTFDIPDENGRVVINLVDELILIEDLKAKVPLVSSGELSASMTAVATSLSFTTPITDEYGAVSATGHIAIEKEVMSYEVTSSTTMNIARSQFGSAASEHNSGETIQKCVVYNNVNIIDIITDLINNYTKIPASYIPTTEWNALKTGDLALHNYTRVLFKPVEVKKVLNELIMLSGISMYIDVIEQKIKIVSIPDFSNPVITFTQDEHFIQNSIRIKRVEKNQVTRQSIFWDKADATESNETKNYRKKFQVINGIVEGDADISNVSEPKPLKCDWLGNSLEDNQLATSFAQRQVNRFSQVPLDITFKIDQRYIGTVSGGKMWLGATFDIITDRIVDSALNPVATNCQCIKVREIGDQFEITGQTFVAAAPITADLYINEDKEDYLLTDELTTTEAREYSVVINSGVTISSSTTTNAAFRQGAFFAGATVKIYNLGRIIGAGGDGGTGANSGPSNASCTVGTTGDGGDGGDAIDLTTDATIDNGFGLIGGGGGGASGRAPSGLFGCFFEEGDWQARGTGGGGGGQGITGGNGGAGGTGPDGPGFTGSNGTAGAPGNGAGGLGEAGISEQGGTGGNAGAAIQTNGNSVTITSGNNTEQLKGAIA